MYLALQRRDKPTMHLATAGLKFAMLTTSQARDLGLTDAAQLENRWNLVGTSNRVSAGAD